MNDRERQETAAQLLELLVAYRRTLYELERREAMADVLDVPLALRGELVDVRERIDEKEAALLNLAGRDPTDQIARRVREAQVRQAQAEAHHVRALQRIRRRKIAELEKRQAMHGPSQAPLDLVSSLAAEQEALAELDARLRQAQAAQARAADSVPPTVSPTVAGTQEEPISFLALLSAHFNREELRTLCFELDVDYDDLPAQGKTAKARELIAYLTRRDRLADLFQTGARLRPDVPWHRVPGTPEEGEPPETIALSIVAPDGGRYETEVPPDTLVAEVRVAFLAEWSPQAEREETGPTRHTLRRTVDGRPLDLSQTLAEAGIESGATLYLVRESLAPSSPVGLVVEGPEGERYTAAVRLDTPVQQLAQAFVDMLHVGGEATVEIVSGPGGSTLRRPLRSNATLYDERVSDGAQLRILPSLGA
jgi:hypothetical protein